jgi:hypothetical protein
MQKTEQSPAVVENDEPEGDYTTRSELEELAEDFTLGKEHIVMIEEPIGVNVNEFYKMFFQNKAEYSHLNFHEFRGEKKLSVTDWGDADPPNLTYAGYKITESRVLDLEV